MNPELALIPLITALMMVVKQIPPLKADGRQWLLPIISMGLGVGAVFAVNQSADPSFILTGLMYGLAAAGLYDVPSTVLKAAKT